MRLVQLRRPCGASAKAKNGPSNLVRDRRDTGYNVSQYFALLTSTFQLFSGMSLKVNKSCVLKRWYSIELKSKLIDSQRNQPSIRLN